MVVIFGVIGDENIVGVGWSLFKQFTCAWEDRALHLRKSRDVKGGRQ